MRARDFCNFFAGLPSITLEKDAALLWRLVPDIRMVIPGDIISYAPVKQFTKFDSADMKTLLVHVRCAAVSGS
jgi:hypothetical protein